MNLEEKIGQMLIVGFKGATVTADSPIIHDIQERNLGGVILFDRFLAEKRPDNNIISLQQVKELIRNLQANAQTPLLIGVDQEGGNVTRFKKERGFAPTPAAKDLGQEQSTEATAIAAKQTATLLKDLGVNLNLAPVVDLDTNPDNPIIGNYRRSFSCNPEQVAAHAATWITTHRKYGIKSCLKHFPGHGSARADSHLGFVDVSDYWQQNELQPYRRLFARGLADAVMTGHLYNRRLDPDYPATLSRSTVNGLLRDQLGYDGAVLSDDMQMQAITRHYGLEEAVCRAIRAGVDLLVFGNNLDYSPAIAKHVIAAIQQGIEKGLLDEADIDMAYQRIQRLKHT